MMKGKRLMMMLLVMLMRVLKEVLGWMAGLPRCKHRNTGSCRCEAKYSNKLNENKRLLLGDV